MTGISMDEERLIKRLRLIEALHAGATTEGERMAAEMARRRILERLKLREKEDPPIEYRFSMGDMWSRKVFVALLRRYGIKPYRYKGQRYTTVMARLSKRFVDETLWPEFQEFSEVLRSYLAEVTERVVSQVIHEDASEAEVVERAPQLSFDIGEEGTADSTAQSGAADREKAKTAKSDKPKPPGKRSKKKGKKRKKRKRR